MGTALMARGLPAGTSPEQWLDARAEEIAAVHAAHVAAGAEVVLTCTFNLASRRVAAARVEELASRAVVVARAAAPGAVVAGAVGPSGLSHPAQPPGPAAALEALHARAFAALAAAGVDLLWAESLYAAGEARAAVRSALGRGRPAVATIAYAGAARGEAVLPDGTSAAALLEELAAMGAAAVGVNCVLPDAPGVDALIERLARRVSVPIVAKPSPGLPGRVIAPQAFGAWCARLRSAGASWIGGCCGATADHVAAAARAVRAP
jgi:5-methyltetrahydrofolate--homocysteine methyltransferase